MIFLSVLYCFLGLIVTYLVIKQPSRFLPIFLISVIVGSGPMIMGYPIIDEYMLLMLLLGLIIRASIGVNIGVAKSRLDSDAKLHEIVFYSFIWYLLFQSFRGLLWLEDPRMIRWVTFFVVVGLCSFILSNYRYSVDRTQIIKVIFYSTNLYFLSYLLYGVVFENFFGINRFDLQGYIWSGTTSAALPIILYSISLISFYNEFKNNKPISYFFISLILILICSIYYNSRVSLFVLLFTVIYFLLNLYKDRFMFFIKALFIVFIVIMVDASTNEVLIKRAISYLPYNFKANEVSIPSSMHFANSDRDRIVSITAAYDTVNKDITSLLFGYGWYMARIEMVETVKLARDKANLVDQVIVNKKYQPSGFGAILVDTGVIGVLLYLFNLFLTIIKIYKSNNKNKFFISIILCSIIPWFFIGNITPLLLIFFLIMPKSPIIMMLETKKITKQINLNK